MADLSVSSNVRDYPIFKHFDDSQIAKKVDSFRTGEKGLFWFVKLGFFLAVGYGLIVYVLPPVFQAIGRVSAVAATGIFVVAFIMAIPVIIKALRTFTRFLHKSVIRYDPFGELDHQKDIMIQNQRAVRASKGTIQGLEQDAEIEADKNEKDAKDYQSKIISLNNKAKDLKAQLDQMVAKGGMAAKGTDDYINANINFTKAVSDSQRIAFQLKQAEDFVSKYGSRAAIMKKFVQKLTMVDAQMDIKILDFSATIEIMQKDFKFAEEAKNATDSAKRALGVQKQWEVQYAFDVVTTTIANDNAITSGNLKDIDALTKNYSVDSDELYTNLDALANNINTGVDIIPEAKAYRNPEYQLTQNDRLNASGLDTIF
jgi:hypothetical protein